MLRSKHGQIMKDSGFHASYLPSFGLLGTLCEHNGCVNRLAWNDDGSILASTSDDLNVCLWDIENATLKCVFPTSHTNNIFGLRFLPCNENRVLITGAMDSVVQHHLLHDDLCGLIETKSFYCHRARVKSIETEKLNPFLFFSAGEDGCVRQFDSRLPNFGCSIRSNAEVNSTGSEYQSTNCLLKSNNSIKIFSMALNPIDSNLLVLATNHTHVNIYDRRMLTVSSPNNLSTAEPVQSFVPPHVARFPNNGAHCTHAEFSPCGRSILATYHTDHSYVFDLNLNKSSSVSKQVSSSSVPSTFQSSFSALSSSSSSPSDQSSGSSDGPVISAQRWSGGLSESLTITPAALPWRLYKDKSPEKIIRAANNSISQGKYMINLGYLTLSYCLYSQAEELGATAVSLCNGHVASSLIDGLCDISLHNRAKKTHARALYRRAMLYLDRRYKGDDDAGLSDIDRALQLNPKNTQYMLKRAVFLVRLRKPDECIQQLTQLEEYGDRNRTQKFSDAFYMLSRAARAQIESRDRLHSLRIQRDENRRSNLRHISQSPYAAADLNTDNRNVMSRDYMRADEPNFRSRAARLDIPVTEYTIAEAFQSIGSKRFHESPVLSSNEGSDAEGFDGEDSAQFNQRMQSTTDGTSSASDGSAHANINDDGGMTTSSSDQKMSSDADSRSESDQSNSTPQSMEVEAEIKTSPPRYHKQKHNQSQFRFPQRQLYDCGYTQRYVGAANIATDIKEAIFFGKNGEYIASGSDDGHLFIWDRLTGELLMSRLADADVVNCVIAHPFLPILVTSGLDDVIRIWGPNRLDGQFGTQSDYIRLFSRKLLSLEDRQKVHAGDVSFLENGKLIIEDLPSKDGFENDTDPTSSRGKSLLLSTQALKDWSTKLSLDQQRRDQSAQDFLLSEKKLSSLDGVSSQAASSPHQNFYSRSNSRATVPDSEGNPVPASMNGEGKSVPSTMQMSGSVEDSRRGTLSGTSFESNSNNPSNHGSSDSQPKQKMQTESSSQSSSQSNGNSQMMAMPAISSSRATADDLTMEDRTMLTRATKGNALSIEEYIAAEKIISDNQKLMQLGPMPLLYQQMLNNLSWDGSSMDDSVVEDTNRCSQS